MRTIDIHHASMCSFNPKPITRCLFHFPKCINHFATAHHHHHHHRQPSFSGYGMHFDRSSFLDAANWSSFNFFVLLGITAFHCRLKIGKWAYKQRMMPGSLLYIYNIDSQNEKKKFFVEILCSRHELNAGREAIKGKLPYNDHAVFFSHRIHRFDGV